MANAINLQELEQELTRTKGMFEQWSKTVMSSVQDCKATHVAKMRAGKGELDALDERSKRAERQVAQVRQQMAQDTEHEQALQDRADSLVSEQHALHKRFKQLQQELGLEADVVQQLAADVAQKRAEYELRTGKLDQLYNAYQDCLGLKLSFKDGGVHLEFTQIDSKEPSRQFGLTVQVVGDNDYKVTQCEPEVEGRRQLEQLLLEERKDFAGFVRLMRQHFKQLVEAGH